MTSSRLAPRLSRIAGLALTLLWLVSARAGAQSGDPAAASAAFSRGQSLQISGDHAGAAEAFELADRLVAAPAALRAAIVNRMAAGHNARAATLALDALARYPSDAETRALSTTTLNELSPKLTRVVVRCAEPCTVVVSGQLVVEEPAERSAFFLVPGEQSLDIGFAGDRHVSHRLSSGPGESIERVFSAPDPAPSAPAPAQVAETTPPETDTSPPPSRRAGLSPAYFWTGVGLTAAAAGLSVWSGLDALAGVDAYEERPTKSRYDEGRKKEVRTNVFVAVAGALGVGTAILGVFTDFGGERAAVSASAYVDAEGGFATVQHHF